MSASVNTPIAAQQGAGTGQELELLGCSYKGGGTGEQPLKVDRDKTDVTEGVEIATKLKLNWNEKAGVIEGVEIATRLKLDGNEKTSVAEGVEVAKELRLD
jgi:hypothetical protein